MTGGGPRRSRPSNRWPVSPCCPFIIAIAVAGQFERELLVGLGVNARITPKLASVSKGHPRINDPWARLLTHHLNRLQLAVSQQLTLAEQRELLGELLALSFYSA
jgi:hypothetical protein